MPTPSPETVDATRRTHLASERTELAWWRTGLTALAVGRVVPGIEGDSTRWPYELVGALFALYGVAVIAYGSVRRGAVDRALAEGATPTRRASPTGPSPAAVWCSACSPSP